MHQNGLAHRRIFPTARSVREMFGFSAKIGPNELLGLAHDRTANGRNRLATTVGDMLEQDLAPREVELINHILMQLVRDAEMDLRRALAERLAHNPNAPHDLMVFLASDDIAVARPVLVMSQVLRDHDLVSIINQKTSYHRRAVARRSELGPNVIEALVVSNDAPAIETLLENHGVLLHNRALDMLAETAKLHTIIRQPLLQRGEINSAFATRLYWLVSQELRGYITNRFQISRADTERALDETLQTLLDSRFDFGHVTHDILDVAQHMREANRISSGLLIQVLRRGQIVPFVALFAEMVGLPVTVIETMILDHNGDTLAVAARAAGLMKPDFASVFLLARAARPGEQVVDPRELSRVLEFYDRVTMVVAQKILTVWKQDDNSFKQKNFALHDLLNNYSRPGTLH